MCRPSWNKLLTVLMMVTSKSIRKLDNVMPAMTEKRGNPEMYVLSSPSLELPAISSGVGFSLSMSEPVVRIEDGLHCLLRMLSSSSPTTLLTVDAVVAVLFNSRASSPSWEMGDLAVHLSTHADVLLGDSVADSSVSRTLISPDCEKN
jgi:hypothetical protein